MLDYTIDTAALTRAVVILQDLRRDVDDLRLVPDGQKPRMRGIVRRLDKALDLLEPIEQTIREESE